MSVNYSSNSAQHSALLATGQVCHACRALSRVPAARAVVHAVAAVSFVARAAPLLVHEQHRRWCARLSRHKETHVTTQALSQHRISIATQGRTIFVAIEEPWAVCRDRLLPRLACMRLVSKGTCSDARAHAPIVLAHCAPVAFVAAFAGARPLLHLVATQS